MRQLIVLTLVSLLAACSAPKSRTESTPTEAPAAATTPAPSAPAADSDRISCAVTGDERVLQVRAKGNGCELAYTKGGKESVVASSANGSDHCKKTAEKMKQRLGGAGFVCK